MSDFTKRKKERNEKQKEKKRGSWAQLMSLATTGLFSSLAPYTILCLRGTRAHTHTHVRMKTSFFMFSKVDGYLIIRGCEAKRPRSLWSLHGGLTAQSPRILSRERPSVFWKTLLLEAFSSSLHIFHFRVYSQKRKTNEPTSLSESFSARQSVAFPPPSVRRSLEL